MLTVGKHLLSFMEKHKQTRSLAPIRDDIVGTFSLAC
jgi:hypothetical protein